jgi:CRP-like cAMP-binding protein/Fe-S-cluster-containing hydrogenase component 2
VAVAVEAPEELEMFSLPEDTPGEAMSYEEVIKIPLLAKCPKNPVDNFPGSVRRRLVRAGEAIMRQGDPGMSAFVVVSGEVEFFYDAAADPSRQGRFGGGGGGLLAKIRGFFGGGGGAAGKGSAEAPAARFVPTDGPVEVRSDRLQYGKPLPGSAKEGGVFGEQACLNQSPRAATAVAKTDCELVEIYRNVFSQARKQEPLKKTLDETYKRYALDGHLRDVPLLRDLPDEERAFLRDKAVLKQDLKADEVILKAGEPNNVGLVLIRLGQVRVWAPLPNGQLTLRYLGRGDCIGEVEMLLNVPCLANCTAYGFGKNAEYYDKLKKVARDRFRKTRIETELVVIPKEAFLEVLNRQPQLRARMEKIAKERYEDGQNLLKSLGADLSKVTAAGVEVKADAVENVSMILQASAGDPNAPATQRALAEDRVRHGRKVLLIDLEKCTRCDQCVDACVASHPEGVSRLVREGPRLDKYLVPSRCQFCFDPVCMIGCPVAAIYRDRDLSMVIRNWCIGCNLCANNCPYDAIQMHFRDDLATGWETEALRNAKKKADSEGKAQPYYMTEATVNGRSRNHIQRAVACDQCRTLPQGPACVYACPHDAAKTEDGRDFVLRLAETAARQGNQTAMGMV